MTKFKVQFYFTDLFLPQRIIECRECSISENAYTFYGGEVGKTNYIIASVPIKSTIVEDITER